MASDPVHQTLAKIGYTLLQVQGTERVVKRVIQVTMPKKADLFASLQEKLSASEIKRPLGPFLSELRKRADLNTDFDALLSRFLVRRNEFIHDTSQPEGWSLLTRTGREVVNRQLLALLADSNEVRDIFLAMLHAWKVQADEPTSDEEETAFKAVLGKYEGGLLSRKWGPDA